MTHRAAAHPLPPRSAPRATRPTALRPAARAAVGLVALGLGLVAARTAVAQGGVPAPRAASGDGVPLPSRTVREAVLTRGEPRSYQVLAVPVPDEFAPTDSVTYEITTSGLGTIVGRREGTVPPGPRGRRVLVTLGIPARALAGRATVATVVFRAPDGSEAETPVDVDVTGVHRLELRGVRELRGARPGDVLEVRYTLVNHGNVRDTARVTLQGPPDWRGRVSTPVHVLAPGATAEGEVRLWVPRAGATGSFAATLTARARATVTEHHVLLDVAPLATGTNGAFGPLVRGGVGAVSVDGSAAAVGTLTLAGALTEHVDVDARVTTTNTLDAAASRGLSRLGYFVAPPFLALAGDRWRVAAGNTASTLTELTGLNVWGAGVSASWRDSTQSALLFAARPSRAPGTPEEGQLVAAQFQRRFGGTEATATLSHLREPAGLRRELTAASLGVARDLGRIGGISGEVAARDYGTGRGVGVTAEFTRETERERGQLRVTHAPGGSEGFARMREELSGTYTLRFAERWGTTVSAFAARDANGAFSLVRSDALSLQQSMQYNQALGFALEVRSTVFDAASRTSATRFGNAEQRASLSTNARWNRLFGNAELAAGRLTRTLTGEGTLPEQAGARLTWRGVAGATTARGTFEFEQTLERNGAGTGFMPHALGLGLRGSQMPVALGRLPVYLGGEVQHQRFGDVRAPLTIVRAGATAPLPLGFDATLDVERNPLFARPDGRASIIVAMKLERSLRLPRAELASTEGLVYRDLDADGVHDADEPGMPGVVVRVGDERATTDRQGRYRLRGRVRGQPTLELASLPSGWVPSEAPATLDVARRELAVLPTANVPIILELTADADGRTPNVELQQALVFARDQKGREWVARRPSATRALFAGLPAGDYTLEFDFTALSEPLRLRGTPTFSVRDREVAPVVVPLYGRPLRFFRPQPAQAPAPAPAASAGAPRDTTVPAPLRDTVVAAPPLEAAIDVAVPEIAGARPAFSITAGATTARPVRPLVLPSARRIRAGRLGRTLSRVPRPGADYQIRSNDSMREMARRAYRREALWKRIHEANRFQVRNPDQIRVGQILIIPKLAPPTLRTEETRRIMERLVVDSLRLALRPGPQR